MSGRKATDQFIVRLPDGMRDRIASAAKAAGRSMNAEIVHRLSESFDPERPGLADLLAKQAEMRAGMVEIEKLVDELAARLTDSTIDNKR